MCSEPGHCPSTAPSPRTSTKFTADLDPSELDDGGVASTPCLQAMLSAQGQGKPSCDPVAGRPFVLHATPGKLLISSVSIDA